MVFLSVISTVFFKDFIGVKFMYQSKVCRISCPYCGERLEVLIDCSIDQQHYIEDCQVCCCPITLDVVVDGDDAYVNVFHENE